MEPATEQKLLEEPTMLTWAQFGYPSQRAVPLGVVCCLRCAKKRTGKLPLHEENACGRNPEDLLQGEHLAGKGLLRVSFVVLIDCYPSVFSHRAFEG